MQPGTTNIKPVTQNEIGLMVDMRFLFAEELSGKQDPEAESVLRPKLQQYFTEELNSTYFSFYAEVQGTVAAIAGLVLRKQPGSFKNPSGHWGYIMNVYTLPSFRRMGLSSQLVKALMDKAAGMGITAFELHATRQGEPAYQKLGFHMHEEPTYRKFIDG